jgi:hypothetical protein
VLPSPTPGVARSGTAGASIGILMGSIAGALLLLLLLLLWTLSRRRRGGQVLRALLRRLLPGTLLTVGP